MWWRYFERVLIKNTPPASTRASRALAPSVGHRHRRLRMRRGRSVARQRRARPNTGPLASLDASQARGSSGFRPPRQSWLQTTPSPTQRSISACSSSTSACRSADPRRCVRVLRRSCSASRAAARQLTAVGVTFAVWIGRGRDPHRARPDLPHRIHGGWLRGRLLGELRLPSDVLRLLALAAVALIASCACWLSTRGTARRPMRTPSAGAFTRREAEGDVRFCCGNLASSGGGGELILNGPYYIHVYGTDNGRAAGSVCAERPPTLRTRYKGQQVQLELNTWR